ncbi:hypothetical protein EVAR_59894_1 [Eumeta japonica]|uniref:Endonuclease/exonuclease/phosphatase domain-containing protein n=1 Tax=Eumeta variegata TaxID=151549 RepID=A0A4C2AEJ9_EUMVA|nr:hypothetical protein EVAR_59894_1 [Eumeta japonica]
MGVAVDRMRKARGQRSPSQKCGSTVIIRDVLRVNSDEDIVRSLRTQNRHLSEGLGWDKVRARVCYRRRARNDLECHPVLEVSPAISSPDQGRLCIRGAPKAPGMGPVPVGAVFALSRIRTWQAFCKEVSERCAHCGEAHWRNMPGPKGWRAPKCVNCTKAGCETPHMGRSAQSAGSEQNGMIWLGRRWRTASSRRPGCRRPHTYGRGSSTEGCTDRVSLRFMQSNLQRSKLATTELLVEAARRKLRVVQRRLRGGTRQSRHNGPEQRRGRRRGSNPQRRKRRSCRNQSRKLQNWRRVGVFRGDMPIGPYLDRVRYVCSKLGTDKIILGGDVNAWSVWWGSERNDARGVDLCDFLDSEGLHILNEGNTPTFEVYRGDRLLKSVVDVTACSSALLDRAEGWQVVRDVTSSDHNAVTFAVRVEGRSGPRPLSGTRVYNTAKARWSEFAAAMDAALNERTLTTEMVKSVGSCDQLDEVVETYTECIRQACDAAIPRKSSNAWTETPGGVPS